MKKKLVEGMPAPKIKKVTGRYMGIARMPADGLCTVDYVDTQEKKVLVRICLAKKEWMNYYPDSGKWDYKDWNNVCEGIPLHEAKIQNNSYVNKITNGHTIIAHQDKISWEKTNQKYKKRSELLKDRCEKVPELTHDMQNWLERYVAQEHWLYYKRKGKYIDFACTACGNSGVAVSKTETYEDMTMMHFEEIPANNYYNKCPLCGETVKAKAAGRTKGVFEKRDHRFIMQAVGEDVVVRYFEPVKYFDGDEMNAKEEIKVYEVARQWLLKDKLQIDYYKYSPYSGENYWDDCNLYGNANIKIHAGKTYRGNMDDILTTRYKYSMLPDMYAQNDYMDVAEYLCAYDKFPQMEMLIKMGMTNLVKYLTEHYRWTKAIHPEGKTITQIFGITKKRFEDLKNQNGGIDLLTTYQMEREFGIQMTDEQVKVITSCSIRREQLYTTLKYATFEKMYNYIIRQSGVDRDAITECTTANHRFRETMIRYVDYIKACEDNERPMTDPHEIYPADITEAHNREILLKSQHQNEIAAKKKNKENPNIKKDAAGYNRKYRYEDKNYIIRAPKDAGEIFMEGLILNHCVGRMGYIEAMNRHETVILFLRHKKNKKNPYYTLEIKDGKIQQAYGYKDKKPDWEQVGPFLEEFKAAKLNKNADLNNIEVAG